MILNSSLLFVSAAVRRVQHRPLLKTHGVTLSLVTISFSISLCIAVSGCSTGSGLTEQAALGIGGLVSKGTVVLRRWGSETQNFGFIN